MKIRMVLALAALLAIASFAWAQFIQPPVKWNAALRCTEVLVRGTEVKMYVCEGTVQPPACPDDMSTMPPGFCWEPRDGTMRFRDGSGAWRF